MKQQISLQPVHFKPLPLGQIKPRGWLLNQLRLQADGISGHLDEFWPDVQHSRWFGGDQEGWERAPYWLDGLVPLAYLLDDDILIKKVKRYLSYILTHQHEDGWLGPRKMVQAGSYVEKDNYDLWALMLMTKVLVQYAEASRDVRAGKALLRVLESVDRHIDNGPLFNWGQSRWFETLIAIYWLYEREGDERLFELAVKLQSQGFDWVSFFQRWSLTAPTEKGRWNYMAHVVNNAMAVKAPGLWWRISGEAHDRLATYDMIEKLDHYHGMVTGVFTGDECLAGTNPVQGTELCAVVEYMYSLEMLLSIFGDPAFGDRLERIAFNALPGTFSPDMWAHQYDQQANQVECSVLENRTWSTNGPDANIFGVDPHFGCCTVNLSQGWPKFTAHLWMELQEGGLAAVAYAPSQVKTLVLGVPVTVTLETDYPFRSDLLFTVEVSTPIKFPILFRIPEWAQGAKLSIQGKPEMYPQPGSFAQAEMEWIGTTQVKLELPMTPILHRRDNNAVAISRGPLVYCLKIGEDWRRIHADQPYREFPHADWEVYPTTPWNYALDVQGGTLHEDLVFEPLSMGEMPFSPEGAPMVAHVQGKRLPSWGTVNGSADSPPLSPVTSDEPVEELTLIPYGCSNLRITEFPQLKR